MIYKSGNQSIISNSYAGDMLIYIGAITFFIGHYNSTDIPGDGH